MSEDHARKTITLDAHPHLSVSAASIHPCRHADVMKRLADNLVAAGREFRADQLRERCGGDWRIGDLDWILLEGRGRRGLEAGEMQRHTHTHTAITL